MEKIKRILAKYVPECEVRVFGSRVAGNVKAYSDLDLAIVAPISLDKNRLQLIRNVFEESDLPFRVDVLDWNSVSDGFRKVIEKHYEVLMTGNGGNIAGAS